MKNLSKFYITLASLMAGMIAVCSIPEISAKYQTSDNGDGFHITFPILTPGQIAANAMAEKLDGILNNNLKDENGNLKEDTYETLLDAMGNTNGRLNKSYIGNVDGSTTEDSQELANLFGNNLTMDLPDENGTIMEDVPITMMIKRKNLDNSTVTGENEYEAGAEITLYITSKEPSGTASPILGGFWGYTLNGNDIEVYAIVYTKIAEGEWEFVQQFKGKATSNNYSSGSWVQNNDSPFNSFDTDTWVSTEIYYNENGEEIAVGVTLDYLVQNEKTAQDNLETIKSGGKTTMPT